MFKLNGSNISSDITRFEDELRFWWIVGFHYIKSTYIHLRTEEDKLLLVTEKNKIKLRSV